MGGDGVNKIAHVFLLVGSTARQVHGFWAMIAVPRPISCSVGNVPLAGAHKSFVSPISLDTKLR
jgi:hypothetical protein